MPYIGLTVAAEPSAELTQRTVEALTDLTVTLLRKERSVTTVVVQYVSPATWARGGVTGSRRFFVDAKITAGTNSRQEKARYIREVHQGLARVLGEPAAGYVAVTEIPADSWGHGGETQEIRYVREAAAA